MPNDFISRKELLQDIQDTIDNSGCVNHEREIIDCVRYTPPADDAVEVVRCKDCRFYAIKQSSLCDMHNTAVNAEDYCSYGTKMDGGEHHAD